MTATLRTALPALQRLVGQRARSVARRVLAPVRGWKLYCPVCENRVLSFLPYGDPPRPAARCPICGSMERHRADWLFLKQHTDLFDGTPKSMLHVAPEHAVSMRFRRIRNLDYLSADLEGSRKAMVAMDITDIHYPDGHFSVIYCSHVLEHIPDDVRAIRELHRVLAPGGWAILNVPVTADRTWEDPTITDDEGRTRAYGLAGHVRRCGPDYSDRIAAAGFVVRRVAPEDLGTVSERARMALHPRHLIFFCRKPRVSV